MLFLRGLLPAVSLARSGLALMLGIGAAALTGWRWPGICAILGLLALGVAYLYLFVRRLKRLEAMAAAGAIDVPDPFQPARLFLGRALLVFWFCLGLLWQGAAAWPSPGRELPAEFSVSGQGRVERLRLLPATSYQGPRVQLTLRLAQRHSTATADGAPELAGLWRRQTGLLLTVEFAQGDQALVEEFGKNALPGAVVAFTGEIRAIREARNPGEWDYGAYLASQGIYCQAAAPWSETLIQRPAGRWQRLFAFLRQGINSQIATHLEARTGAIAAGSLLGDTSTMERQDLQIYRQAGIAHLFAVSGTHGGVLLAAALCLGRLRLFRRRQKTVRLLSLGLLLFYLGLVGFPLSMQRTLIMAALTQTAIMLEREGDSLNALGAAALILLLFRPQSLFGAGFQLSFGVTWGLLYLSPWLRKYLPLWLAVPVAAQLAAMPLQAFWFQQIQPAGFLLNLWAAALISPLLLLSGGGALIGAVSASLSGLFWQAVGFLATLLDSSAAFWVGLPFGVVNVRLRLWPFYVLWGLLVWSLPYWGVWERSVAQWLYQRWLKTGRQAEWRRWQV
ncbi:MAG: ComEC family competence protein, partial [Peptococcaceae bacterium]|nr:ComEC family competence protein [Peptococcaceae bacterium]